MTTVTTVTTPDRVTDWLIAEDLEAASYDNLDTWEALHAYPEQRIAGPAETCDRELVSRDYEEHGAPLVISAYGTWYGSGAVNGFRPVVVTYSCECTAG